MRETKNMKVEIIDEDHVFFDNKQFVSLRRFVDAKRDMVEEVKLLTDKNKELAEENAALKILLKSQLNDTIDISSASNKICRSEFDHEWEWCGTSVFGVKYICKKCNGYRIYPSDSQGPYPHINPYGNINVTEVFNNKNNATEETL